MPYCAKDEGIIIFPVVAVHIGVEPLAEEGLFACSDMANHEAVLVALVAIALHGLPCYILTIRRIAGVGVIATVTFGKVGVCTCSEVVEVDVGVGGNSIIYAALLTAGVGDGFAIGTPCQLLNATERFHR